MGPKAVEATTAVRAAALGCLRFKGLEPWLQPTDTSKLVAAAVK